MTEAEINELTIKYIAVLHALHEQMEGVKVEGDKMAGAVLVIGFPEGSPLLTTQRELEDALPTFEAPFQLFDGRYEETDLFPILIEAFEGGGVPIGFVKYESRWVGTDIALETESLRRVKEEKGIVDDFPREERLLEQATHTVVHAIKSMYGDARLN